jgi:hypothetical protein
VLSDNFQEIQGQLDGHSNRIGLLDARLERVELTLACMQVLLEERLPLRQPAPPAQPEPENGQTGQPGAQTGHSEAQSGHSGQNRGVQGDGEQPLMGETW